MQTANTAIFASLTLEQRAIITTSFEEFYSDPPERNGIGIFCRWVTGELMQPGVQTVPRVPAVQDAVPALPARARRAHDGRRRGEGTGARRHVRAYAHHAYQDSARCRNALRTIIDNMDNDELLCQLFDTVAKKHLQRGVNDAHLIVWLLLSALDTHPSTLTYNVPPPAELETGLARHTQMLSRQLHAGDGRRLVSILAHHCQQH
jgi:hypothetical protein